ncbi:Transcriptional regulatory protein moc3 [Colletotrichum tanaceti]|uniref:Transcriptional regulatory protein moc3 n=1 Tax=Colletotrichum tanaceti TaxID=1306861 RepID=A0A4V6Y9F2_9PEZI|nr:Transcriptional regulatory protein moc3 [Colletotrichum tanaceti]
MLTPRPTRPLPGPLVLTFALENWPRNSGPSTRASKPKVRTGCITCKRRRVKCDEIKPSCQNCLKRRVSCEGYGLKPPRASSQLHQLFRSSHSPIRVEPSYQGLVFTTQLQKDHFDQWLSFAADILVFPSQLITDMIPQIARSDLAVRNAVFAIGAAALGSSTREERLTGKGLYYADALEYYNRALKLTAKSPPTEETFPGVLMTCLLFFVFEALQGGRKAALTHLNHGSNILNQYEKRVQNRRDPMVEAIASNFQRLTLQSWSHNGNHPKGTEAQAPWCCRGQTRRYAVDEMPDTFRSLDEAHQWWEVTQHHIIHHAPISIGFRVEGTGNKAPSFPANQSLPISPEHVKRHNRFVEEWLARFKPLLKAHEGTEMDDKERLKALGLRIHSKYLSIPIMTANYTDADALAQMTPVFREYVALSEEFLLLQKRLTKAEGETFTVDSNSPTWPLGAAAMLCVDGAVKADAVQLLRGFPRRDGLWDTQVWMSMMQSYESAKVVIAGGGGGGGGEKKDARHLFDVEVVFDDKSVVWIRQVEDPSSASLGDLEYRMNLP